MIIKKNKNNNIQKQNGTISSEKTVSPKPAQQQIETPEIHIPSAKEREERRRGDRRRGYRRVDDRNLISRAQEEANVIKESASRDGFEYGLNVSKSELTNLNNAILELVTAKEKLMEKSAPDIAFLAVKAAEKIIKKQLEIDDTIVLGVIAEVIKSVGKDTTSIIIKVNPADAQIAEDNIPEFYPYGDKDTKITIIKDEEVDWGSCIVETKNGIVDANFSTQLNILQKAIEAEI